MKTLLSQISQILPTYLLVCGFRFRISGPPLGIWVKKFFGWCLFLRFLIFPPRERVLSRTPRKRGRPERAATPLAHALYIPLSLPRIFYAWSFIRPRRLLTEQYTEGLHWSSPARGAVLYTDKFPLMAEPGLRTREILAMHRTQRAPFDEKHAHQRRP